jgi:predicted membrane protein DUF2306
MNTSLEKHRVLAIWIPLIGSMLVASYFLATDAAEYLVSFAPAAYGRHWPARNWMFAHIVTGAAALALGALQLCLGLLRRTSQLHRWAGRAYVGAVIVACVASVAVLRNGTVLGSVFAALLLVLSACALLSTGMGVRAALHRHFQAHSRWMIRSYMAMMVFAWFRLGMLLPVLHDAPLQVRAATILAATMLITLGGTELVLRRFRPLRNQPPRVSITSLATRPLPERVKP